MLKAKPIKVPFQEIIMIYDNNKTTKHPKTGNCYDTYTTNS